MYFIFINSFFPIDQNLFFILVDSALYYIFSLLQCYEQILLVNFRTKLSILILFSLNQISVESFPYIYTYRHRALVNSRKLVKTTTEINRTSIYAMNQHRLHFACITLFNSYIFIFFYACKRVGSVRMVLYECLEEINASPTHTKKNVRKEINPN